MSFPACPSGVVLSDSDSDSDSDYHWTEFQRRENEPAFQMLRERLQQTLSGVVTRPRLGYIELWDHQGVRSTVDDVELDAFETRHPDLAHRFTRTNRFGAATSLPVLTVRDVCLAAVSSMMQYVVLEDVNYKVVESDSQGRCSLLLHLHIIKLSIEYNLPQLEKKARLNFSEDVELSCYTDAQPRELYEAIRFLYSQLRLQIELRQVMAHYCVSSYNYHRLHQSEAFQQTTFECGAFHKDLLLANLRSDFSSDSAYQIIFLPVCRHPVHRTHEAWLTGSTDFTCQFHDGQTFESRPNTPRAGTQDPISENETSARLLLASSSPAITPVSITPVPSSPSTQGSWSEIDSDAEWSDAELPPSYESAVKEALKRLEPAMEHQPVRGPLTVSLPERPRSRAFDIWDGEDDDDDDNYGDDEHEEQDDGEDEEDKGSKTDTEEELKSSVISLGIRPREAGGASGSEMSRCAGEQAEKLALESSFSSSSSSSSTRGRRDNDDAVAAAVTSDSDWTLL